MHDILVDVLQTLMCELARCLSFAMCLRCLVLANTSKLLHDFYCASARDPMPKTKGRRGPFQYNPCNACISWCVSFVHAFAFTYILQLVSWAMLPPSPARMFGQHGVTWHALQDGTGA